MEFEDVLLYSPFGSSPAGGKNWRIFLNNIKGSTKAAPAFSEEKHNILAIELKILYTAITRARQRVGFPLSSSMRFDFNIRLLVQLWIFDTDQESRETMFEYWNSLNLIDIVSSSNSVSFLSLAEKSSPEKWMKQGKAFFDRREYESALLCFNQEYRGRPTPEAKERCTLAEANMMRVRALRQMQEGKMTDASASFEKAAMLYLRLGGERRRKLAAVCFEVEFIIRRFAVLATIITGFSCSVVATILVQQISTWHSIYLSMLLVAFY
jgi:tetratricopeptide (TPR) repeat protein